jgi:hypothetical protein
MKLFLLAIVCIFALSSAEELASESVSAGGLTDTLGEARITTQAEKEAKQAAEDKARAKAAREAPKDSLDKVHSADMLHTAVKQTLVEEEKLYSLMSYNFRKGAKGAYSYVDYYVRHMNRAMMISTVNGPMDRQDSTFKVVHAMCEPGKGKCPAANEGSTGCISLESTNFPGYFLSSTDKQAAQLLKADGSQGFNLRASLCIQPGLSDKDAVSLEFLGQKGKFLRHSGYSLFACKEGDKGECAASSRKESFNDDATFYLKAGLFMGRCNGPAKTTDCTCFPGFLGEDCTMTCPGRERKGTVVKVCTGQGDCALTKKGVAGCKCQSGFLGRKCNLLCPRDKSENLCSGHGECAVNDKFQPVCDCKKGFMGKLCQYECPGRGKNEYCTGHGSCFIKEANLAKKQPKRAECTCNAGFKGFTCNQKCPADAEGTICGGHGTCVLKGETASCACLYGWRGKDCTLSCPRSERGAVCGGQGFCKVDAKSGAAKCTCKKGYGGKACTIACPGVQGAGAPCGNNGSCEFDLKKKKATCNCKKTHMGTACEYRCPMDPHSNLACGGNHRGQCVKDKEALPDGTRCDCKEPFVGSTCHVTCPSSRGKICSGQGECFMKKIGKLTQGLCKCDVGFIGSTCAEKCPANKAGVPCSGHGTCSVNIANQASCKCDEGWINKNCNMRVCRTEGGVFSKTTEQCTCPQGEVCCTKETQRLAGMMTQMLKKEKAHLKAKKAISQL